MTTEEFNKYYQENYQVLKGFIRKRVRNNDADAEDLTQESFLSFYRMADTNKNPIGYLYQIAKRKVIDFYRRKKVRNPELTNMGGSPDSTRHRVRPSLLDRPVPPDTTFDLSEYELSPEMKLRLEGYKFREIAEKLNIPQGTVRSRFYYERARLRKVLQ